MNIPDRELLIKCHNAPGLLSKEEVKMINDWMKYFNKHLIAYKEALGEPAGYCVQAMIEKLDWYEERE